MESANNTCCATLRVAASERSPHCHGRRAPVSSNPPLLSRLALGPRTPFATWLRFPRRGRAPLSGVRPGHGILTLCASASAERTACPRVIGDKRPTHTPSQAISGSRPLGEHRLLTGDMRWETNNTAGRVWEARRQLAGMGGASVHAEVSTRFSSASPPTMMALSHSPLGARTGAGMRAIAVIKPRMIKEPEPDHDSPRPPSPDKLYLQP
jgi:hypothetical protein